MKLVLLIEDDRAYMRQYSVSLRNVGFEVVGASNGEDALQIARENGKRFDIILSDTYLRNEDPGVMGYNLVISMQGERLFRDDVLYVGMSSRPDQERHWERVSHYFLPKSNIENLGFTLKELLASFEGKNRKKSG